MQPSIETWAAPDGTIITIRPLTSWDLALEQDFVNNLSPMTRYRRMMSARRLSLEDLRRLTDIDSEHELALIATMPVQGKERQVGVARYIREHQSMDAEFAIVLSDDWQRRGLGTRLLLRLIEAAKCNGVGRLFGMTLSENHGMLALGRKLGFVHAVDSGSATISKLSMQLAGWSAAGSSDIGVRAV